MINFYTMDENKKIKEITKMEKECWIDIINPNFEELEKISNKTNTDLDLLTKLLDDEELPRIEEGDNATLIVVDTPYVTDSKYKHKYNTDPLGIIINNDGYFIGYIKSKENIVLKNLMDWGKIIYGKIANISEDYKEIELALYLSYEDVIKEVSNAFNIAGTFFT